VLGLLPSSHRKRVKLLWGSIAGAAVLTVAALIVFVPNTGHSTQTPIDQSKAAARYHAPKTVPATAAEKAAALRTLTTFVRSAFIRRNLALSWPLATSHMRQGTSRSDWLAGDLPVVPYPAEAFRAFGATLKYQYKRVLGYDVLVLPKVNAAGRGAGQQVYACELHDVGGSWLVDFCYPRKTL
jgi:hypothetical protein